MASSVRTTADPNGKKNQKGSKESKEVKKVIYSLTNIEEKQPLRSFVYFIVFCLTRLITWGIISAFPVLFVAFLEHFNESRSKTAIIGSLQVGLLYMLTIIPGYLIPIYGFRLILVIGALILACGFISSIFVTNIYYLYLTMGIITSLGTSILMTGSDSAPLVVFRKWRGTVTILSTTAASVGFAVMPMTTSYLIYYYGLEGGLLLMAGIVLQLAVLGMLYPSQYTSRDHTEETDIDNNYDGTEQNKGVRKYIEIIKKPTFWCLTASQLAIDSLSTGCRVFLVDRAISQGISESTAVLGLSLLGVVSSIAILFIQLPLVNKTSKRRQITFVTVLFCWSLVTLLLVVYKTLAGFFMYCILGGIFHGFSTTLWYLVLADIMERRLLVSALSLNFFIAGPYVMFSVPIGGMIYDRTRNYDAPYLIYACIGIFGAICEGFIPFIQKNKTKKLEAINSAHVQT